MEPFFWGAREVTSTLDVHRSQIYRIPMLFFSIPNVNTKFWPIKYVKAFAEYKQHTTESVSRVAASFARQASTKALVALIREEFELRLLAQETFTAQDVMSFFGVVRTTVTNWQDAGILTSITGAPSFKSKSITPEVACQFSQSALRRLGTWHHPLV